MIPSFAFKGRWRKGFVTVFSVILIGVTAPVATAREHSFSWASNPPPVTGYRLYYKKGGFAGPPFYGTDAAEGASPIEVGNNTSVAINVPDSNDTYHFALTAVYGDQESGFSHTITVRPSVVRDPKLLMVVQVIQRLLVLDKE